LTFCPWQYYFDVHPPLAKLLNAFAGYVAGFKGDFDFENISDDYVANGVPYVGMRALPALLGTAAVPVVYAIMRETGHMPAVAALSAALLAFGECSEVGWGKRGQGRRRRGSGDKNEELAG